MATPTANLALVGFSDVEEFRELPSSLRSSLLQIAEAARGRSLVHLVCRFENDALASIHESKMRLKYRRIPGA